MARIRSIKPEFWTSEQVMECSPMARLLFIGIWNFCDDAGNHVASPRTIKANVLPGDDIDSTTVQGLLDELYRNGLIDFYVVDSKRYLHVTGWHHQRIDKPTYRHPEYLQGVNDEKSESARRTIVEPSTTEWSGEERIGVEETIPLTPLPGGESPPPEKPKRERKPRTTLKTFVTACSDAGERPISDYRPLLDYVEASGLPMEFVQLAWEVFKSEFLPGGANENRLQADWRRHFLNYVKKGYYRLWFAKQGEGGAVEYALSTQGLQAQAALENRRRAA